jgi:LacI family transcriptional regulator
MKTVHRKDPSPLYRQVKERLISALDSGRYTSQPLPTERELAEQLNVSRVTVRRALGDLAAEGRILRVPSRGTFAAKRESVLQTPAPKTIVIPNTLGDFREAVFYVRMMDGIQTAAPSHVSVALRKINCAPQEMVARLEADPSISGMILMGLGVESEVATLATSKLPTVVCDCSLPAEFSNVDVVTHAHEGGAYAAATALMDLGHHDIALMVSSQSADPATAVIHQIPGLRKRGFERALQARGLSIRPEWLCLVIPACATGYSAARRLLSSTPRPTAILCSADETAVGAIAAARDMGLKVPDDVSIAGYGDIGLFSTPALSTVRMNSEASGQAAMRLLLERLENPALAPRRVVMPTEFIARGSTGIPPFNH